MTPAEAAVHGLQALALVVISGGLGLCITAEALRVFRDKEDR